MFVYIVKFFTIMINTLKKYDEIVALYGDTLNKLANASDIECAEAFLKRPIPQQWQEILAPFAQMEIPFYFGLMPAEFWQALIEKRPDIAEAANCFENGKVALVCLAKADIETLGEILSPNNPNAGFHWCDILINRPFFVKYANEKGAWDIIKNTVFCVEALVQAKPQFVRKFQFEDIIAGIDDEDKKAFFLSNPDLMSACETNFPEQWQKFSKEILKA